LRAAQKATRTTLPAMRAEDLKDFDAAVDYYLKATKVDPHNANFQIKLNQARFEASQQHVHQGMKLLDKKRFARRPLRVPARAGVRSLEFRRRSGSKKNAGAYRGARRREPGRRGAPG